MQEQGHAGASRKSKIGKGQKIIVEQESKIMLFLKDVTGIGVMVMKRNFMNAYAIAAEISGEMSQICLVLIHADIAGG